MNLFKTPGADYVNLDQVTRFECDANQITLHFEGENQLTLPGDDATRLARLIVEFVSDPSGRIPAR